MPVAASPAASGNSIDNNIANCRQHGGATARKGSGDRRPACSRKPMIGVRQDTTTATSSSPQPVECKRIGGALYSHDRNRVAASHSATDRAAPARATRKMVAATATAARIRAARRATERGNSPAVRTRLPPDHRVGVVLARSAARSK